MASAHTGTTAYTTTLSPLDDLQELIRGWQEIEKQLTHPIFIDALWIQTWIQTYDPNALVARVTHQGELVALGLFGLATERRHGVVRSRVAYLHQTGVSGEDQIWVEYNGLLARPGHEAAALQSATNTLLAQGLCHEIHLSMLPVEIAEAACQNFLHARRLLQQPGYWFAASGSGPRDPLAALSRNTRAQIRRSLRLYGQHGQARIDTPNSVGEALAFLHEAGARHRERWSDSGFENPAFVSFHESLIKRGFDHGRTRLFRVAFGERVLGVFYYLVSGPHAYFYLQGVRRESDGKLKPGLTGHYLLMQHLLENGLDTYDFMGGESQYKQQLSNGGNVFASLRVHNGARRFRLEDLGRAIKQRLQGR